MPVLSDETAKSAATSGGPERNEFVAFTAGDRRCDSQVRFGKAGFHTGVVLGAAF